MSGARPKDPGRKNILPEYKENHPNNPRSLYLDRDGEHQPARSDVENWREVRPNRSQRFCALPSNVPRNNQSHERDLKTNLMPLRLQDLKQILLNHSVIDATKALSDRTDELNVLLNNDKITDEVIEILIRIFVRVFEYNASDTTETVVNIIIESTFLKNALITYVTRLGDNLKKDDQDESQMIKRIEEKVDLVIFFLEALISDMAGHVNDIDIAVTLLDLKCQELLSMRTFSKDALIKVMRFKKRTKAQISETKSEEKKRRQLALAEREGIFDGPPPDDYRDIPILPTSDDLHSRELPFLRPNITKGSYSSHYHYLDVQFRLLREDFVCPLRDGIQTHLSNLDNPLPRNQRKRNTDVRLYYDVTIQHPVFTHREEGVLYRVKFSLCNLKGIKWQNTKRLIYGSLVCLSHDSFKTLLFGTVTERNEDLLRSGMVDIKLHNIDNMDPTRVYTMVESTAFYESYRPVLQVLQQFNEGSIPMENYIIRASHDIQQPKYLRDKPGLKYNIGPLLKNKAQILDRESLYYSPNRFRKDQLEIDILNEDAWPDTDELGLDASQLSAVKSALTKELAVIQGPPGTGKTYIGLKIVETLLINRKCWTVAREDGNRHNCSNNIMVICYTNHALDQFLEGILKFCFTKLVRIGGRSKSEDLVRFNLKNLIKIRREREDEDTQKTINNISKRMIGAEEMIKFCDKYIVSEHTLENVIAHRHFRCLNDSREEYGVDGKRSSLPTWLGLLFKSDDLNQGVVDDNENNKDLDKDIPDKEDEQEHNVKNIVTEFDMLINQREYNDPTGKQDFETRKETISKSLYSALAYHPNMKCKDSPLKEHRPTVLKELTIKDDAMTDEEANRCSNIWRLSRKDKWRLYRYWIIKYKVKLRQVLFEQQKIYDELVGRRVRQQVHEAKCDVLMDAYVIGMTTTGAAKNKSLLNDVRPRIVIVEEAAEILEAHIITSLTQQCEHLILIGDHQQLKPNPTVYKLATKFNLDTSLFERMLKNGIPCQKLSSQHRMRPEIADIMRKHFYTHLQDDESVKIFDDVGGVTHNLFFINHEIQEQSDEDILSKSNVQEAEYCVALARYLVQQGYDASEITILTTYTGQVLNIKEILKSKTYNCLCDIYVSAVDNYQGEENEIILLSLVRSNEAGNIGFLKVSNRMCVALSRARKGLFCIGNFNLLSESNNLWMKIINDMRSKSRVGNHLELYCQNHPNTKVNASVANDFNECPLGGCKLKCETRLDCGHVCPMLCHPRDPSHKEYVCREGCVRKCTRGHDCNLLCFNKCLPCKINVNKTLPCQHVIQIACNQFDKSMDCTRPCERLLHCGHACRELCFEKCTTECKEIVTKSFLSCGHNTKVQCYVKSCQVPCEKKLPCGHNCKKKCGEFTCTVMCTEVIDKTFQCGHTVNVPCCASMCTLPCKKKRDCGHSCPKQCGESCGRCILQVKKELTCGHHQIMPCHMDVRLWSKMCRQVCSKNLSCGHKCMSKCSDRCSTSKCTELVKKKLTCDHEKDIPCNVDPNNRIYSGTGLSSYRLNRGMRYSDFDLLCEVRINVTRKCGHEIMIHCWQKLTIDSTDCKESVIETLLCGHDVTRVCSEAGICYNRCTRLLPCGHKCKEICSEPCTKNCYEKVEKKLKCEHMKMVRCFVDVSQMVSTGEAACQVEKEIELPCGHKETQLCSKGDQPVTCRQQCSRKLTCGHLCTKKCVEECSVDSCRQRCKFTLACGHMCEGICKNCLNERIHCSCNQQCSKILICGHVCQEYCSLIPCQPCKQQCESRCWHKICRKTCSEVCEPCKSSCEWQCLHFKCTKACNELCNRKRCNYPCPKTLKCKHKCFALCGEQCVCLKCNPRSSTSATTASGGIQKYVFLYDCSHAIEVSKMDQYMDKDEGVRRKECPLCQTIIRYNPRYGNVLKTIDMRITAVKRKMIAERSMKQVHEKRKNILSRLSDLQTVDKRLLLKELNSRSGIPYARLLSMDIIIVILEKVQTIRGNLSLLNEQSEISCADFLKKLDNFEANVFQSNNIASEQVLVDFASKLKRLRLSVQLENYETYDVFEALGLLELDSLNSNKSLVQIAEETFDTCLSFCRDDWLTCSVNHVFRAKHRNEGVRYKSKCQECALFKQIRDDDESKTKQNDVMPDVQDATQKLHPTKQTKNTRTEKNKQLKVSEVLSIHKSRHEKFSNKNETEKHGDKYVASNSKQRSTTKTTGTREPQKQQKNKQKHVEQPKQDQHSDKRKRGKRGKGKGSGRRSDR